MIGILCASCINGMCASTIITFTLFLVLKTVEVTPLRLCQAQAHSLHEQQLEGTAQGHHSPLKCASKLRTFIPERQPTYKCKAQGPHQC